jgi:hypothetical protein
MRSSHLRRASRFHASRGLFLTSLVAAIVLPFGGATAAQLYVTASGDGDIVGEPVRIGVQLRASGQEGPGEVSIVLEWGFERLHPQALGAMTLESPPTVLNPALSASIGDDCLGSIGTLAGRCALGLTFAEPTEDGVNPLVELDFIYRWIPQPGYVLCSGIEAGCVDAFQNVQMVVSGTVFEGAPIFVSLEFGTFGRPRVRPIPEPSAAALIGMGLSFLPLVAGRGRGRGRRDQADRAGA